MTSRRRREAWPDHELPGPVGALFAASIHALGKPPLEGNSQCVLAPAGGVPVTPQRAHGTYDELAKGGGFDARAFIADLGSVGHLPRRHLGPPLPTVDRRSHRDHRPRVAELIASDLRKVDIRVVLRRRATSRRIATGFDDGRSLGTCATRRRRLARQPEPPTLVLKEPSCYHFRVLDPRLPLRARSLVAPETVLR